MRRIIALAALAGVLGLAGCGMKQQMDVLYIITGDTSAVTVSATWTEGSVYKESGVELPWELEFQADSGQRIILFVTNEGTGFFEVKVYIDNVLQVKDSATGAGEKVEIIFWAEGANTRGELPSGEPSQP